MREIIIDRKNEGGRLDKLVSGYMGLAPKGFVYKQLRKKNIVLNDKKAVGNEILKCGDSVKMYFSESTFESFCVNLKKEKQIHDNTSILKMIVYEDDNIIVLNKPAGMLSQKSKPEDISLNDHICDYLNEKSGQGFTPGISNRLDRNTSGLVVCGKNPAAVRELNRAIKERDLTKKYWCIVKGVVEKPEHVEACFSKDRNNNIVQVENNDVGCQETEKIITEYRPLKTNGNETLLEVHLITGKSHQIRAHLAYLRHPLAGDAKYGNKDFNLVFAEKYSLKYQLLHAKMIEFFNMQGILDYLNGQVFEAELPDEFKTILTGDKLWPHGTAGD